MEKLTLVNKLVLLKVHLQYCVVEVKFKLFMEKHIRIRADLNTINLILFKFFEIILLSLSKFVFSVFINVCELPASVFGILTNLRMENKFLFLSLLFSFVFLVHSFLSNINFVAKTFMDVFIEVETFSKLS